ncbi:MAG: signal peptidase I, partial [Thermoprotei archaeon]
LLLFSAVDFAMGVPPFYVVSDNPSSMSPTINYGWIVVIYRVPFQQLHAGDIIVFNDPRGNSGVIIHRIVSANDCNGQLCFSTKGDNNRTNPTPDPWNVTQNYYIGEVIAIIPYLGYLTPALWGFRGLTALLPVTFVILLVALLLVAKRMLKGDQPASQPIQSRPDQSLLTMPPVVSL